MIKQTTQSLWIVTSPFDGRELMAKTEEDAKSLLEYQLRIASLPTQIVSYGVLERYYDGYRIIKLEENAKVVIDESNVPGFFYQLYKVSNDFKGARTIMRINKETVYAVGEAECAFLKVCFTLSNKNFLSLPLTQARVTKNASAVLETVRDMTESVSNVLKDYIDELEGV